MTLPSQELRSVDLRDVPLDQLATLGDSVLAHCVALYRQRIESDGVVFSAFNSNI
jgi:FXSXX-COOH protein